MKKILYLLFVSIFLNHLFSKELDLHEDFKSGDIVSAETFNQIFNNIEKINNSIKDEDLLGSWNCDSFVVTDEILNIDGWTNILSRTPDSQGSSIIGYRNSSGQITFSSSLSNESLEDPYFFTTSAPGVFTVGPNQDVGVYSLAKNFLIIRFDQTQSPVFKSYNIDLKSASRIILSPVYGEQSYTLADFIICDEMNPIPPPPKLVTAQNKSTLIELKWSSDSTNQEEFRIYRKTESSDFALIHSTSSNLFEDSVNLIEGTKYFYYISSVNDQGESEKSKVVSATFDSIKPTVSANVSDGATLNTSTNIIFTFSENIHKTMSPEKFSPTAEIGNYSGGSYGGGSSSSGGSYNFVSCDSSTELEYAAKIQVLVSAGTSPSYLCAYPSSLKASENSLGNLSSSFWLNFNTGQYSSWTITILANNIYDSNGNKMESDFSVSLIDGTM